MDHCTITLTEHRVHLFYLPQSFENLIMLLSKGSVFLFSLLDLRDLFSCLDNSRGEITAAISCIKSPDLAGQVNMDPFYLVIRCHMVICDISLGFHTVFCRTIEQAADFSKINVVQSTAPIWVDVHPGKVEGVPIHDG